MKAQMLPRLTSLLQRQWLTPMSALRLCGCLSLSQRCGDLRRSGRTVLDKWVKLPNGKRVKAYRIVGGGASEQVATD